MSLILQAPAWLRSNAIARAIPIGVEDPRLAFMLAQQSVTRWQQQGERLGELVDAGVDGEPQLAEANLALQQLGALRERIAPFANYLDIAVRFEAQEILAAIGQLTHDFERIVRRISPAPWRDPAKLVRALKRLHAA